MARRSQRTAPLHPPRWVQLLALIFLLNTGCVSRAGRNSDCKWPGTSGAGSLHGDRAALIRSDVELAEELAIRYMDAHDGPGDPAAAGAARNRCLGILLGEIGKEHGIAPSEAFRYFGRRSLAVDVAINLPFALFYCFAADLAVRRLFRRYPPGESRLAIGLVLILACLACGLVGLALAEQWAVWAEMARVGNWHLSNRALRLPVAQYRTEAFAAATAVFLGIGLVRYRTGRHDPIAG